MDGRERTHKDFLGGWHVLYLDRSRDYTGPCMHQIDGCVHLICVYRTVYK